MAWGEELLGFWNDSYARILGDREAVMGTRLADLWPDIFPTINPVAKAAMNGTASYFEDLPIKLLRNGVPEQTWWTFGYSPIRMKNGQVGGMIATITETTRYVLLERELAAKREALRRFNNLVPDLLWESGSQGEIVSMNEPMVEFAGLDSKSLSDWTQLVHPDDIPGIVAAVAHAQEKSNRFESQHRLRRADGQYRWFLARANPVTDEAGDITGWYGCASDIHEWRLATEQLQQSQELLRRFAEGADKIMWIAALDNGEIEFVNLAARRFVESLGGIPKEHWSNWSAVLHPDDRALGTDALARLKEGETLEIVVRLADGGAGFPRVRATLFPIREPDGRVLRFGGIGQPLETASRRLVHLVDPDRETHRRLSAQLWAGGFEVHGFTDIHAFAKVVPALLPGCVVLRAGSHSGWLVRAAAAARQSQARLRILALSEEHRDVDHVRDLLKLGVHDVLPADIEGDDLSAAIDEALGGLEPAASEQGAKEMSERMGRLSRREREILDRLVGGATNKLIAIELGISPRTVEAHRARILERLEVSSLAEAIAIAVEARVAPPGNNFQASGTLRRTT